MHKCVLVFMLIFITSCGSQAWRHGNPHDDHGVVSKREKERDRYMERASDFRVKTTKHYIKEWKSHDGDINIFRRDGFDWGF